MHKGDNMDDDDDDDNDDDDGDDDDDGSNNNNNNNNNNTLYSKASVFTVKGPRNKKDITKPKK
jgi:hypothetical protein